MKEKSLEFIKNTMKKVKVHINMKIEILPSKHYLTGKKNMGKLRLNKGDVPWWGGPPQEETAPFSLSKSHGYRQTSLMTVI